MFAAFKEGQRISATYVGDAGGGDMEIEITSSKKFSHGASADIYKGKVLGSGRSISGRIVALKVFSMTDPPDPAREQLCRREELVGRAARHPYILPCWGFTSVGCYTVIVTPFMKYGNIARYDWRLGLDESGYAARIELLWQLAQAVYYLHDSLGVVHGDLKPENVLISNDGKVLLTDFGLCSSAIKGEPDLQLALELKGASVMPVEEPGIVRFSKSLSANRYSYTAGFVAPELLHSDIGKTTQSDVFAFGMVVLRVMHGKFPYLDQKVVDPQLPLPEDKPYFLLNWGIEKNNILSSICRTILDPQPSRRPDMKAVLSLLQTEIDRLLENKRVDSLALSLCHQLNSYSSPSDLPALTALLDDVASTGYGRQCLIKASYGQLGDGGLIILSWRKVYGEKPFAPVARMLGNILKGWHPKATTQRISEILGTRDRGTSEIFQWPIDSGYCHTLIGFTTESVVFLLGPFRFISSYDIETGLKVDVSLKPTFGAGVGSVSWDDGKNIAGAQNNTGSTMLRFDSPSEEGPIQLPPPGSPYDERDSGDFWKLSALENIRHCMHQQGYRWHRISLAPDSMHVVSTPGDQTIQLWRWHAELDRLERLGLCLLGHEGTVSNALFSPVDSATVASSSHDRTVRIWDAKGGLQRLRLEGHTRGVNAVAFAPSGRHVASASDDRSVRVWDVVTGETVLVLRHPTRSITSVLFSPDGAKIVSTEWRI